MSNIGSEHFIGLAGSGAATGIGVGSYEWQVRQMGQIPLINFFIGPAQAGRYGNSSPTNDL